MEYVFYFSSTKPVEKAMVYPPIISMLESTRCSIFFLCFCLHFFPDSHFSTPKGLYNMENASDLDTLLSNNFESPKVTMSDLRVQTSWWGSKNLLYFGLKGGISNIFTHHPSLSHGILHS